MDWKVQPVGKQVRKTQQSNILRRLQSISKIVERDAEGSQEREKPETTKVWLWLSPPYSMSLASDTLLCQNWPRGLGRYLYYAHSAVMGVNPAKADAIGIVAAISSTDCQSHTRELVRDEVGFSPNSVCGVAKV